jgi:hypothetical protein
MIIGFASLSYSYRRAASTADRAAAELQQICTDYRRSGGRLMLLPGEYPGIGRHTFVWQFRLVPTKPDVADGDPELYVTLGGDLLAANPPGWLGRVHETAVARGDQPAIACWR